MSTIDFRHPEYLIKMNEWEKFRYIQRGGDQFIEKYVVKHSDYETPAEFELRKSRTPIAGFAKAALKDIQNSIYQRLDAIVREGGTGTWLEAIKGKLGGVDLKGSDMNHFMGTEVLEEFLFMGKVGVYTDNYNILGPRTLHNRKNEHPYHYIFQAEDIFNWEYFLRDEEYKLKMVFLRVREPTTEPELNLICAYAEKFRKYWMDEETGEVFCMELNVEGKPLDYLGNVSTEELATVKLDVKEIPLVILETTSPLLADIANHQIALTNMESADVDYAIRSNVVFYTEQYDQRHEAAMFQMAQRENDGTEDSPNPQVIKLGGTTGRRYPINTERPEFVSPPGEPLQVSMEKQKALKDDIRQLVNLALSNTKSRFASAESKELDDRGLESGLSAIGLDLEHVERKLAKLWSDYESNESEITVIYPKRYSIQTDRERREDAKELTEIASSVPSKTFRKSMQKQAAIKLLATRVPDSVLDRILDEIDAADFPTSNPDELRSDAEIGLVSHETASVARGYPAGEAKKAKEEKVEREKAIRDAQAPKLNNQDIQSDPVTAKDQKQQSQDPANNPDGIKKVRGEA